MGRLRVIPCTLRQANAFVEEYHRHHVPARGHRFALAVTDDFGMVGAAIVGRPVARETDQYFVAEILRLVTNGQRNVCSKLYGACARAAREMGYHRIQTYILESEPGTTLIAAGYEFDGMTAGGDWNTPSRGGRRTDQPQDRKQRWKRDLNEPFQIKRDILSC